MRVPAGLDPHQHRPLQSFVESSRFLRSQQPAPDQLARFLVQHCYHLKARMKVTAYILHMRPPSSRALRSLPNPVYSRLLGAVVVIQSTGAPRQFCTFREISGAEWRDPEGVSSAMPLRGVLSVESP